jgi:hypothetical protein
MTRSSHEPHRPNDPSTGLDNSSLVLAGCACFLAGFGWLAQTHADSGYLTSVLGPTLLIAVGIGLTFPTLMAAATADVPEGDAGIIGGLANTAHQVGGSIGLAVHATAASTRTATETDGSSPTAALATGFDLVFLIAAGLARGHRRSQRATATAPARLAGQDQAADPVQFH